MGLIKAITGAAGGVLADQWKEYFYCESLDAGTLVTKGRKRVSGRSSNTKAVDNIISNGSVVAVADGQCMIIVEQGKVVDVCAEPGEYTYDMSTEPSIFFGDLGESIKNVFMNIGKRFTFGGEAPKDQRVYYFNTKEIMDNKFGTPSPIIFEVTNKSIGFSRTVNVRCNGVYSYTITNPLVFYTNVCGNVKNALPSANCSVSKCALMFNPASDFCISSGKVSNTFAKESFETSFRTMNRRWSPLGVHAYLKANSMFF